MASEQIDDALFGMELKTYEFKPRKVHHQQFDWTECALEISQKRMFRFSIASTHDSYFCFSEEKSMSAKLINIVLGGWNSTCSVVNWWKVERPPPGGWQTSPDSEIGRRYGWREAKCHSGRDKPDWYEVEWDIDSDEGPSMRISRI